MNGLGLAMISADSFNRENQALVERQRQAERYAAEKQRTDADLGGLADVTAARRSGLRLQAAQSQAGLDSLPAETALKQARVALEQGSTNAQIARQPKENAAADNRADVVKALSDYAAEDLPRVLREKRSQGAIQDVEAGQHVVTALHDLLRTGADQPTVMNFLGQVREALPGLVKGNAPASYSYEPDASGERAFIAKDEAGQPVVQISDGQFRQIRDLVRKPQVKQLAAGTSLVKVGEDGVVTPQYTATDHPRGGAGVRSLTPAQEANNKQIEISRRKVAGMTPDEIKRKTRRYGDTGRDNPEYDGTLANHVRLANKRKIGQDDWFDEQGMGQQQDIGPTQQTIQQRFADDPGMKGHTLGKQTERGLEVLNPSGKLIGYYE